MIFLKLLLLLLGFVAVDPVRQSEEFIMIAATQSNQYSVVYLLDFKLKFLRQTGYFYFVNTTDKLFFGSNALFGQFKNSDVFLTVDLHTEKHKNATITGAKDMLFVGPGSDDNLYFYSPKSKSFLAYQFGGPTTIKRVVKGFEFEDKLVVIGKNHCNKDWVYLLRCSSTKNSAFIFDLKSGSVVFEYPNINPSKCFDIWGVSPNGKKIYYLEPTEKGHTIFHEIRGYNQPRQIHENEIMKDPISIAAGNEEVFYTFAVDEVQTGYMKKFVENGRPLSHKQVPSNALATAIVAFQPTKECWNPKSTS